MENRTITLGQWVKRLTFYEILIGMKATITVFIQRIILRNRSAVTLQYPHEKRDLRLTKPQLLALGDRNFPERERKIEFQHHNVAFFNLGHHDLPPMTSKDQPPVTP